MKKLLVLTILLGFAWSTSTAADSTKMQMKKMQMKHDSLSHKAKPDSMEMKSKMKERKTYMTESGVKYEDLVVGKGNECKMGTTVDCHYTLWFADSTGKKITRFQSSKDAPGAKPFQCTIGQNLIQGWSEGMVGMKEGGTRQLTIPPHLGYGEKGYGPIAGNQWLVFEIDYVKFIKQN